LILFSLLSLFHSTRTNLHTLQPETSLDNLLRKTFNDYWTRCLNIAAYLLKARTVEVDKQPLLGNGPYAAEGSVTYAVTSSNNRRNIASDVLWVRMARVAAQLRNKRISAAVNQHATIEEAVFSVGSPRGYITRISRS
jgi:hypothetical protein